MNFNPDDIGIANGNYFGFPFTESESKLVLISAPWDVTVSYGEGTANGPRAIIEASTQVEVYDRHNPDGYRHGIATRETDEWIEKNSKKFRRRATRVIEHLEQGGDFEDDHIRELLDQINQAGEELNQRIHRTAQQIIADGRIPALVGGDHSTPLGLIRALGEHHKKIGILHIDAHCDLRKSYEGFTYSHASIMYNALQLPSVEKLVQVSIRDYSHDELQRAKSDPRIVQFDDHTLVEAAFEGLTWGEQCRQIVNCLPDKVYVSFDIDGLSPDNCPNTGTPVPGGMSYQQAVYLLAQIVNSGRSIIGFDLVEVSPCTDSDEQWNANIGARILYKLCNLTLPKYG